MSRQTRAQIAKFLIHLSAVACLLFTSSEGRAVDAHISPRLWYAIENLNTGRSSEILDDVNQTALHFDQDTIPLVGVSLPRQTASNSESVPRSPSGSPPRELQLVLFPSGLASWNPGISHERSGFHTRHFGPIRSPQTASDRDSGGDLRRFDQIVDNDSLSSEKSAPAAG